MPSSLGKEPSDDTDVISRPPEELCQNSLELVSMTKRRAISKNIDKVLGFASNEKVYQLQTINKEVYEAVESIISRLYLVKSTIIEKNDPRLEDNQASYDG